MNGLLHYTCDHGRDGIGKAGEVQTIRARDKTDVLTRAGHGWMTDVSWFTDLGSARPEWLGLTSHRIACDRMTYRYVVTDDDGLMPWLSVCRRWPRPDVHWLNMADGALPAHWWISVGPVPVRLDGTYRRTAA